MDNFNSPSKRRWISKAKEFLIKCNSSKVPEKTFSAQEQSDTQLLLKYAEFYLDKIEHFPRFEEMESLLDDADCIGVNDTETFDKFQEKHQQVIMFSETIENEIDQLSSKKARFYAIIEILSTIMNLGIGFASADELKNIVELNKEAIESITEKMSIERLNMIISQLESNTEIVDPSMLTQLNTRYENLLNLKEKAEDIIRISSISFLNEEELNTCVNEIKKNLFECCLNDKLKAMQKIVETLRKLSAGIYSQQNSGKGSVSSVNTKLINSAGKSSSDVVLSGIKNQNLLSQDEMDLE